MPDIPGSGLIQLGKGISNLGAGLASLSRRQQQAQESIVTGEMRGQLIQAKTLFYDFTDRFNAQLDPRLPESIPHSKISEEWGKAKQSFLDQMPDILTLPDSRLAFEEWAIEKFQKQDTYVRETAQDQWAEERTNQWYAAMEDRVQAGDPEGAEEIWNDGKESFADPKSAQSLLEDIIPRANFNSAKNDLFALPIEQSMGLVQELNWGSTWDLDEKQQKDLKGIIENRFSGLTEETEMAAYQGFNDFTRDLTSTHLVELPREELSKYTDPSSRFYVGKDREAEVEGFIKQYDKMITDGATAAKKLDQSSLYNSMSLDLLTWDGEGPPPWKLSGLKKLVREESITETQGDKLVADFQKIEEEISKGVRTPERIQQNRNNTGFVGQMYTALDGLKDPRVAVTVSDIEEALAYGRISLKQHDNLLALRDRLGADWERRIADSKTKNGPMFEDPFAIAELWGIVLDETLDTTEKLKRARSFKFNGVPGNMWESITGKIDEFSGDPAKESVLKNLNSVYNAIIHESTTSDPNRKKKILEKANAGEAMLNLFRQYPDDPGKWDEALQSILKPIGKRQLHLMLQRKLSARFGGFTSPEWMTLETAREQFPEEFAARPAFQMQHAIAGPEIEKAEKEKLEKAGHTIVDQAMTPTGDRVYSTVPIPRDAFGNPDLAAVAKSGNLYVVRSRVKGRKIIQEILP